MGVYQIFALVITKTRTNNTMAIVSQVALIDSV